MLYNYTVTLQSKQGPRRFKTTAKSLTEVISRLKETKLGQNVQIKSIMRKPK